MMNSPEVTVFVFSFAVFSHVINRLVVHMYVSSHLHVLLNLFIKGIARLWNKGISFPPFCDQKEERKKKNQWSIPLETVLGP